MIPGSLATSGKLRRMPFAYRPRKPTEPAGRSGGGRTTLLAAELGDRSRAQVALTIARRLVEVSRRDVVLLSDLAPVRAMAGALEPVPLDRRATYDLLVVQEGETEIRLSPRMIGLLASLRLASTRRVAPNGGTRVYSRPREPGASRALFVFPGVFAPPRIGSHQRAFSTVLDLIEAGWDVDMLVKDGRELNPRVRNHLALLSPRVETYEGAGPAGAELAHEDREAADVDDVARSLVAGMVRTAGYKLIVVSFPWMVSILDGLDTGDARIVCDTHDVVSNRQRELAGDGAGETFAARERAYLSRCDAVLAISRSDAGLFETQLGLSNVVVHRLTYHPVDAAAEWRRTGGPLRFGFLGSDMEANRRALKLTMEEWWPAIEAFSPESRLVVAGTVARSKEVSPYVILRENVVNAGFVENLAEFFASIDVLLAPTTVRAGVNIKNVEALLHRRVVIANRLGAESLAPLVLPTVCESAAEVTALVARIDRNEPELTAAIERSFDEAAAYHAKPAPSLWAKGA